jgi:hypothetical protein
MDGNVKANSSLSLSCNGIVKKQSFKSIIANPAGIMAGEGKPREKGSQIAKLSWLAWLCQLCEGHAPIYVFLCPFFSITKIGLFHGLLESSTCPAFICCCTKI